VRGDKGKIGFDKGGAEACEERGVEIKYSDPGFTRNVWLVKMI
jgi:hypothetical protein